MMVAVLGLPAAGGSEDVPGWGTYRQTTGAGLQQRRQACSKSSMQHCSQEARKQHGVARLVTKGKGKLEAR